jgi:hypothetical protein
MSYPPIFKCGICGVVNSRTVCPTCNTKLAATGDDAKWLEAAAKWLKGES